MTANISIRQALRATSFAAQSSLVPYSSLGVDLIASVPASKIKQLSTSQIQSISTSAIRNLTTAQISALTTDQIVSLIGAQFEALQTNQLSQLSVKQIQSIEAQDVSKLSTVQIATLNRWQISALTRNQMSALSTSQIQAIHSSSISALTNTQIDGLSIDQLGALTTAQSASMTVNQLFKASQKRPDLIAEIKPEEIKNNIGSLKACSASQVAHLTASQAAAISPNEFEKLRADFFTQLNDSAFSSLTRTQIAEFSTAQVASLSTNKLMLIDPQKISAMHGIQVLTPEQLHILSTAQIAALGVHQVNVMTFSQIDSLSTTQIKAIDTQDFAGMKQQQVGALNARQLNALGSEQVSAISAKKLNVISTDVLQTLSTNVIRALTSAQLQRLNAEHLTALSAEQLNGLSDSQIKGLAPSQIRTFTTGQIASLASNAIGAMKVSQIRALTQTQIASIGEAQAAGLSSDKLSSLNNSQLRALTPSAINKLNETGALSALTDAQKLVSGVTDQFKNPITIYTYRLSPSSLLAGQAVTIAGLTFTAIKDLSANEVLKAFSNLKTDAQQGSATDLGTYAGKLVGFTTSVSDDKASLLLQSSIQTTVNDPPAIQTKGYPSPSSPAVSVSQGAAAVAFRMGQPQVLAYALPAMNVGDLLAFTTVPNAWPTLDNQMVFRCIQKIDGSLADDGKATTAVTNAITGHLDGYLTVTNRSGISSDGNFSYYPISTPLGTLLAFGHGNLALSFSGVRIYNHDASDVYNRGVGLNPVAAYSSRGIEQINPVTEHTEYAQVNFTSLKRGQVISISGLSFQAKTDMSATEVASAFANVAEGGAGVVDSSKGQFSGGLTGYSSSGASSDFVLFTSTTPFVNVPDLRCGVGAEPAPDFGAVTLISKAIRKNGVTVIEPL